MTEWKSLINVDEELFLQTAFEGVRRVKMVDGLLWCVKCFGKVLTSFHLIRPRIVA